MTAPSDLLHFFAYLRAFEGACLGDDWSPLEPHFAPDARHELPGGGPFGRGQQGRAAVIGGLRDSVRGVDRRFDVRIPELLEGPELRPEGVWMRYALTLRRAGVPELRLEGDHLARFEGGRITLLVDRPQPARVAHAERLLREHDAALRAPGSPFAPPDDPRDRADLDAAVARTLVRCYGAAKSRQDVAAALALCSEDFRLETVSFGLVSRDRKEAEQQLAVFFRAFPDYRVRLDGLAHGDGAAACWGRARLTFAGEFLGQPPTGRSAELPIFCVFPCAGGALRGERFFFDAATLCEQIGLPLAVVEAALRPLRASES